VKILLPIDESPFSNEAIREVEDRFGTPDTTVCVLHAVAKFVPPVTTLLDAGGTVAAARAQVMNQFQDLVDEVTARLQAQGITVKAIVKDGDPRKVIVKEAQEWGADLIVMGSHAYGPIKRVILGSVSQYVVDHAPCSVEIVHRKEPPRDE
jgi:nucleotide-binding universal stress UspA family protein